MDELGIREEIILAARAFSRLEYLHGFGHISARVANGTLITPTRPGFMAQKPDELLVLNSGGDVVSGEEKTRPIEFYLHAAIYAVRPDVNAICRTHSPFASSIQMQQAIPPVRHGFGGIAKNIGFFDEVDLIHSMNHGRAAAEALANGDALILRGNGTLSVGDTLCRAAANVWSVEERLNPDRDNNAVPFSEEEYERRSRWYGPEIQRVWAWLKDLGQLGLPS